MNLRPIRVFEGLESPVRRALPGEVDLVVVRENVEGEYSEIGGRGIPNPIGAIWTASMMLEHLGHAEAAAQILSAIAAVLAKTTIRTPDLGGTATTTTFTAAVLEQLA